MPASTTISSKGAENGVTLESPPPNSDANHEEGADFNRQPEASSTDDGDDYDSDNDDDDIPDFIRSIRSSTGLETGFEIDWPNYPRTLHFSTCLQPKDIAPMFDGTQWAGTRIWRASIVAIDYLLQEFRHGDNNSDYLQSTQRFLELGCGLGVPGIMLKALLDWNIVLTDKDPLPKQLEANSRTNFPDDYGYSIWAEELDWSRQGIQELIQRHQQKGYCLDPTRLPENGSSQGGFDVVLNCDCVYEPLYGESWKFLAETIDELLCANPKTFMITSLERRKADGVEKFLDALDRSQHVSRVERIHYDDSKYPEVQLYRIHGLA